MKPVNKSSFFLLILLAFTMPAIGQRQTNLFSQGSDEQYWIVRVVPNADKSGHSSTINVRQLGQDQWDSIEKIGGRVVDCAVRGQQLAVILDNGDWMLVSPGQGASIQRSLINGHKLLAIAGDQNNLWAVGTIASAPTTAEVASTRSLAVEPARPATTQATNGRSGMLGLFMLDRSGIWIVQQALPADIRADAQFSMTVHEGRPVLATMQSQTEIQLLTYSNDDRWTSSKIISSQSPIHNFKLFVVAGRPALWLLNDGGKASLIYDALGAARESNLPLPANALSSIDHSITAAFERIRLVYVHDKKLFEQRYDLAGAVSGEPVELSNAPAATEKTMSFWINLTIMVVLAFAIASTLRKRKTLAARDKSDGSDKS
jgi:hypothetical protein